MVAVDAVPPKIVTSLAADNVTVNLPVKELASTVFIPFPLSNASAPSVKDCTSVASPVTSLSVSTPVTPVKSASAFPTARVENSKISVFAPPLIVSADVKCSAFILIVSAPAPPVIVKV